MPGGDLDGRAALVTGGSRGIGFATARELARRGAEVLITARSEEAAVAAAAEIGPGAVGCAAHASDEDAAAAAVELALERFGRLDVLFNNVGTNPAVGPLVDQERTAVAKVFEVNVWAPVLWTGLAWRAWMRDHGGVVVNNASLGGLVTSPDLGIYNASKAALIHLTKQLALELAPRVRVNAVAPGVVRTRLSEKLWKEREGEAVAATALARIGEPSEVAAAVAFLASDSAAWITGETLVLDGGQRLASP